MVLEVEVEAPWPEVLEEEVPWTMVLEDHWPIMLGVEAEAHWSMPQDLSSISVDDSCSLWENLWM
jgi:hypothetical protein